MRSEGRTEWELCFVVTKVKLSIYLLAYLSHFYSERLICPPQWDEILSKVAYLFLWTGKRYDISIVFVKVEMIFKGSLDSIPSPSIKIQIMGAKVSLMCKGKTLLGVVYKIGKTKSLLTSPNNVLPHYLK
jgi:hypothetical protein